MPTIAAALALTVAGFGVGTFTARSPAPGSPARLALMSRSAAATAAGSSATACPVSPASSTGSGAARSTASGAARSTGSGATVADGFAALGRGTTGGAAGRTVTVSTTDALRRYAAATEPYVITVIGRLMVSGQIDVAANKSIVGGSAGAGLTGGGLNVRKVSNVVIADLVLSKAKGTDAVSIWGSDHVLVTHNDLSSDLDHGKDYYDGLVDVTQGSDDVTVSYNRFHDHYKVMLVGHSDDNGSVDTGKLHITVHHNSFVRVGSRLPSLRFGVGHVYDNVLTDVANSAIHSRMGATVLAQDNVFLRVKKPYVTHGDSRQDGRILIDPHQSPSWAYSYHLDNAAAVAAIVASHAGPRH